MPIFIFTKELFWKRPSDKVTERLKIMVIRTYTEIHRAAQRYTEIHRDKLHSHSMHFSHSMNSRH